MDGHRYADVVMIAKSRLFLTADRSRVVEEGNPDAAYLLVGAGCELPDAIARQYGLLYGEEKAIEAPPENKAILYAPENKRQSRRFKRAQ
jgi:hypothetical protein